MKLTGKQMRTLVGCFIGMGVGIHSLPLYTQGLFVLPLGSSFGWSRLQVSFGGTILVVALALSSPVAGALADRYPLNRLILASAAAIGVSFTLLAMTSANILTFYGSMALMAVLGSACSSLSFSAIVSRNFDRRRGAALGFTLMGTGVANTIAPIALGGLIAHAGWRAAYLAQAGVMAASLIPLWLLLPKDGPPPRDKHTSALGSSSREALSGALRQREIWIMGAAFLLITLAVSGLVGHFVPLLVDAGMSPVQASARVAIVGASVVICRLGVGVAVDRLPATRVAAVILLASAVGIGAMARFGPSASIFAAIATGASVGMEIDLIGYLASRYVDPSVFGRVYGILYTLCLVGVAASPLLYAWIFGSTRSYHLALVGATAILVIAALLFCLMRPYREPSAPTDFQGAG